MKQPNILIVDDEHDEHIKIVEYFSDTKFIFSSAYDFNDLKAKLDNNVNVIILDLNFYSDGEQEVNPAGLEYLKYIIDNYPYIPTIIFTRFTQHPNTRNALVRGAYDVVSKTDPDAWSRLDDDMNNILCQPDIFLQKYFLNRLPYPLGILYKLFIKETNSDSKVRIVFDFIDAALRLFCYISICEKPMIINNLSTKNDIRKPTLGKLYNLLTALLKNDRGEFTQYFDFILHKEVSRKLTYTIELRNKIYHRPSLLKSDYANIFNVFEYLLIPSLNKFSSLDLAFTTKQEYKNEFFTQHYDVYRGDNPAFPVDDVVSIGKPIESDTVYMINKKDKNFVKLHPFIIVRDNLEYGLSSPLYFNHMNMNSKKAVYHDYYTGFSIKSSKLYDEINSIIFS
jgi:CheY-like chemotaxis protein